MRWTRPALIRAYKNVFSTDEGKAVLHDLLRPMWRTSIAGGEANSVREGERNVALKILSIIKYDEKKLSELFDQSREYEIAYGNDDNGNNDSGAISRW